MNHDKIKELIDNAYLNLGNIDLSQVKGPFVDGVFDSTREDFLPTRLFEVFRDPCYLGFVCKHILNITSAPFQNAILYNMWTHPFPMLVGSRGLGKSFILAVYSVLVALLIPGSKIVLVGAAFRQSKFLFEYVQKIWFSSDILRDICGNDGKQGPHIEQDKCTMVIGDSVITAIPIGDGGKIRGLRATVTISDEFSSLSRSIFENVIIGFGAVSADPVENVKREAARQIMESLGLEDQVMEHKKRTNQVIIAGTAYYSFNHFYDYWEQYKKIILSRGNKQKLSEIFPEGIPDSFNWKDYCVIRMPYELIPKGFMDVKQIERAKATIHSSSFLIEYSGCFAKDSNGFYKRTLIETCVCKDGKPIELASGQEVSFSARLKGDKNRKYIIGIDPASEKDNFSIVVLESHGDHRRIVYIWTTNRTHYKNELKNGRTNKDDFYGFCARKIRDLMKLFPTEAIALDTQGGGVAIEEALHSANNMLEGEQPIWPIIIEDKEQDTDDKAGLHILHKISFASADWVREANHGMKKDFEDKKLLFPYFDTVTIAMSIEEDKRNGVKENTLEDCVLEIEDLKDELATIVHTQTMNGRDRWDTPETKEPGGKKGRQRKDRYSALLMANDVARRLERVEVQPEYQPYGGFINTIDTKNRGNGPLFTGPAWYKFNF